jgi:hypothetical protein
MSLIVWAANGWIEPHKPSPREIADQLAMADRDIHDSQVVALSPEWKLNIAYNAAMRCATAALYAAGYRASRDMHHHRTIQSLAHTLQLDSETIQTFDSFRRLRNVSDYDQAGMVSNPQADEMLQLAIDLRFRVGKWLCDQHPELMA